MALANKERLTNLALLVLRVGLGAQLALYHGLEKFQHFAQRAAHFPDPLGMGSRNSLMVTVAAELVGAIFLVLGLAGRAPALLVATSLGVAAFVQAGAASWQSRELTLLYFAAAVALVLMGSGRLSFDALVFPRLFRRGGSGGRSVQMSRAPAP